jgi:hypothetical protein
MSKRITTKPKKRMTKDGRRTEYVIVGGSPGVQFHREGNRPALVDLDRQTEYYYYLGKLHRTDGPAEINYATGICAYWVFGTWYYSTGIDYDEPTPQRILAWLEAAKKADDILAAMKMGLSKGLK